MRNPELNGAGSQFILISVTCPSAGSTCLLYPHEPLPTFPAWRGTTGQWEAGGRQKPGSLPICTKLHWWVIRAATPPLWEFRMCLSQPVPGVPEPVNTPSPTSLQPGGGGSPLLVLISGWHIWLLALSLCFIICILNT